MHRTCLSLKIESREVVCSELVSECDSSKASLPFALTQAQEFQEIELIWKSDSLTWIVSYKGMGRKTVVSDLVMFAAVTVGYQAVLMVPTETLQSTLWEFTEPFSHLKSLLTGLWKLQKREKFWDHCWSGEVLTDL